MFLSPKTRKNVTHSLELAASGDEMNSDQILLFLIAIMVTCQCDRPRTIEGKNELLVPKAMIVGDTGVMCSTGNCKFNDNFIQIYKNLNIKSW